MTKAYNYLFAQVRTMGSWFANPVWARYVGLNPAGQVPNQRAVLPLDTMAKVLAVLVTISGGIACWLNWDRLEQTRNTMLDSPYGIVFLVSSQVFLLTNIAFFIWQIMQVRKYQPSPVRGDDELPTCTVVVPAYNEGKHVLMTLRSLAASDYPEEKLQIIAVDDGSKDDTWQWMLQAARELPGRITTLQLRKNSGKRRALYEGFLRATGEILVTVDSDSIVEPPTVRRLVSPFIGDEKCGAVAGNVRVLNLHEGLIPRMLDVSFVFSFEFIRSGQSMVNTVFCTPGALSAYRRDVVYQVLPAWLTQKFWGKPNDIGEDRAITNMILRRGYNVLFQDDAVVYTNVPTDYKQLCRMLIRWARSNVRENLDMTEFLFDKFREGSAVGARIHLCMQWLWTLSAPVFLTMILYCLYWRPQIFAINILCGLALWSTLPAMIYYLRYRTSEAMWSYVFGLFNFVALSWIGPYSLFTVHKGGWLTRQSPASATEAAPTMVPANSFRPAVATVSPSKAA